MSETGYVYRSVEPGLWTVGFYDPSGKWHPESDHESRDAAGARVHYLNGGSDMPASFGEALNSGDGSYHP